MSTVKRCHQCQAWFPVPPGSWVNYCPNCLTPKIQKQLLQKIKKIRQIPFEWFDLWDTQYPFKTGKDGYERVCRICGNRLVGKKGTYLSSRRYCYTPCCGIDLMKCYDWTTVRHEKLHQNYRRKDHGHHCELCGKIMPKSYGIANPPVHHKVPVHTLTKDSLYLIWDLSNLIVLCPGCHKLQDHQLKAVYKGKTRNPAMTKGQLEKWMKRRKIR